MQPIGGYFSLEINDGWGYHNEALRHNSGVMLSVEENPWN